MGKQEEIEAFAKENGIVTEGFEYYDYTEEENRLALAEEYTAKYDEFSAKAVARKSKDPVESSAVFIKTPPCRLCGGRKRIFHRRCNL